MSTTVLWSFPVPHVGKIGLWSYYVLRLLQHRIRHFLLWINSYVQYIIACILLYYILWVRASICSHPCFTLNSNNFLFSFSYQQWNSEDSSSAYGLTTNGRAHLSSSLTKWLLFLMSTIKGKVSLLQHSVYLLQPSMSIDVCLHLIIELFCEHLSSSITSLSHYTRLMSNYFLFATFRFAIVFPRS